MEETYVKIYLYESDKPELSDDVLEHFGIKGMKWGVRKDKPKSGKRRKGSSSKKPVTKRQKRKAREEEIKSKSKEDIIKSKDLEAMSKRKSEFSNNEINEALNRLGTEQRLDQAVKQQNPTTKDKIKKVINSKEFKIAAGVACVAIPVAIYAAKKASRDSHMILGPAVSSSVTSKSNAGRKIGKSTYDNPYLKAYTTHAGSKGNKVVNETAGFIMYSPKYKTPAAPNMDKASSALAQLIFGVNIKKGR